MGVLPEVEEFLGRFFCPKNQVGLAHVDSDDSAHRSKARLRPWVDFLRSDPPTTTVLPYQRDTSSVDWYGVARSDRELRALGEELRAFVGPTYAGFRGERARLDPQSPVEAAVAAFTGGRAFRIAAPATPAAQRALWHALELMREVRARRVERRLDVPRTTARALYDFRMALLAGDRAEAEAHLRYLRDGHRLDALNLLFLRVQILAALRQWSELLNLPELSTLLQVRRPFAVTQALIGAVYHEELAPRESLDDPRVAAEHFTESIYPRYAPLYAVRAGMRTVEALKSFMFVAVGTPGDPRLRDEILATGGIPEVDRAYLVRLATLLPTAAPEPAVDPIQAAAAAAMHGDLDAAFPLALSAPASLARTRILLLCADQFQTLAAEREAVEAVVGLTGEERADLLRVNRDRKLWEHMSGRGSDEGALPGRAVVPSGWLEWWELLNAGGAHPDWLREVARRGADEWTIAAILDGPGGAASLAALLNGTRTIQGDAVLKDSLPYLLGALQQDARWPRPELAESYDAVLTVLVMQCRGGDAELDLFLDVAGALLSLGSDAARYDALVQNGIDLWKDFAAPRTVTWALDLVDLLTAHPAAAADVRLRLVVAVAQRFKEPQIGPRMTPVERDFFGVLCRGLDYPEIYDDFGLAARPAEEQVGAAELDLYDRLGHQTVAVYTLTESVGHRVRDVLLERCGTISVELCHDHVCTNRLRSLARQADIFLVATGSAKHAATNCIEANRGEGLPLLRPSGRGSASMLAELQSYLAGRE
jgi:hypothetical protein